MPKCGQCGCKIMNDKHSPSYYSGDVRVCSKMCAMKRIHDIKNVDFMLEHPNKWNKLIQQNKSLVKEPETSECSNCSKECILESMYECPWCQPSKSEKYCSISCQHKHWINGGHSNVCWRMGRVQPTEYKSTPSFINLINDFSSNFINSCIHWM